LFLAQEIFDSIFLAVIQKAIRLILTLSAPMLLAAIGTGIAVSIFQATTKIQEQTLSFVPKIAATFAAVVMYAPKVKDEASAFLLEILNYIYQMQVDAVLQ
jgi:flagellar biosynthesis protein FliQ